MGLFDEESESDEDRRAAPVVADRDGGAAADADDEEDPLDAYMKSLDAPAPPSASASDSEERRRGRGGGGGRLDVEAEDEATSHWEVAPPSDSGDRGTALLPPARDDGEGRAGAAPPSPSPDVRAREARSAMSITFVRAGGARAREPAGGGGDGAGNDDGEDDCLDDSDRARKRRQELMHQEIDPLERVDHGGVRYGSFRRSFYSPSDTRAGREWRSEHDVVCSPSDFDPVLGFGELAGGGGNPRSDAVFPEDLLMAIAKSGYDSPTIVQSQTLPVALSGRDALITAATGSGKTLAYIWPMIVHIHDQPHIVQGVDGPIAIVLTPTRELAKQVYKYAKTFVGCIGGKAVEVAGGNRGTWELTKELRKGCEIVVSSPGRLIDMVKKKGTNLRRVTFLVLDEADRMLDMGFEKQVSSILENIRPDRQTMLLSATFGKRVERVARGWLRDPVRIAVGRTGASSEHVDSHVMVLPSRDSKVQWLVEMLPVLSPLGRCLVFVATRADCDFLSQTVQTSSKSRLTMTTIVSIHGDKDQRDRNAAISQFKKNSNSILIATDVASRGLDIPDVMVVINFDPAKNMDAHVHRVGRAGRLQKERSGRYSREHQRGVAYTLLTGRDANFAASLADAFDREGREVSAELTALCQKSGRFGGGRAKHSKVGLGFGDGVGGNRTGGGMPRVSRSGPPPNNDQPTKKRSRWG